MADVQGYPLRQRKDGHWAQTAPRVVPAESQRIVVPGSAVTSLAVKYRPTSAGGGKQIVVSLPV